VRGGVFCWLDFSLLRFFLASLPCFIQGKRNEEAKRTFAGQ